jgi:hypothetical protein
LHVVPTPWNTPGAAHAAALATTRQQRPMQHAPLMGHGVRAQLTLAYQVFAGEQPAWLVIVQLPVGSQHEPSGPLRQSSVTCTPHAAPAPSHTPPHAAAVVMLQLGVTQQAPRVGHGLVGAQVSPGECEPPQSGWVTKVHARPLQQAPHGVSEHDPPLDHDPPAAAQAL